MSDETKSLLCHGYTRKHYPSYFLPVIIKLLAHFFTLDLHTIDHIKSPSGHAKFLSPLFSINSIKWYLELWPNGCNNNSRNMKLFVCCYRGSFTANPSLKQITAEYTTTLKETNTTVSNISIFTPDHWYYATLGYWMDHHPMNVSDIQSLTSITIEFTVKLQMTSITPSISYPSCEYVWNIEDPFIVKQMQYAPNVYGFPSPIFQFYGLKWAISFYPNGSRITRGNQPNFFLYLASVPSVDCEVHIRMSSFFGEYIDENVIRYDINSEGNGHTVRCGTVEDLRKLNRFCFMKRIQLVYIHGMEVKEDEDDTVRIYEAAKREKLIKVDLSGDEKKEDGDKLKVDFKCFGFDWRLCVNDKGNLLLYVGDGPFIENQVDILCIRCLVNVKELEKQWILKAIFHKECRMKDWGCERVKVKEIEKLDNCEVRIFMELIDVFVDGQNVIQQYVDKN